MRLEVCGEVIGINILINLIENSMFSDGGVKIKYKKKDATM